MENLPFAYNQTSEYKYQIFLPVMIWLIGMLVVTILCLKKYTFGKWTKDNPNPYLKETLGLPMGFFRGLLTLTLLFVVILFETVMIKDDGFESRAHMLLAAFQMMIAFYFGSKVMHHIASVDVKKTRANVDGQIEAHKFDMERTNLEMGMGGGKGFSSNESGGEEEEDETSVG